MLSNSIIEEDPRWLRNASEEELREFVRVLDENRNHPRHDLLMKAFDKECNRRAAEYYESRNGGEWI